MSKQYCLSLLICVHLCSCASNLLWRPGVQFGNERPLNGRENDSLKVKIAIRFSNSVFNERKGDFSYQPISPFEKDVYSQILRTTTSVIKERCLNCTINVLEPVIVDSIGRQLPKIDSMILQEKHIVIPGTKSDLFLFFDFSLDRKTGGSVLGPVGEVDYFHNLFSYGMFFRNDSLQWKRGNFASKPEVSLFSNSIYISSVKRLINRIF